VTAGRRDNASREEALTENDAVDVRVRLATYEFFVEEARAPVAAEVAELLDIAPVDVEQSFRRLHDAHVLVLAPGSPYIWMAHPFSALPTSYRARVGDRNYWANCAWDVFGIVAMLGGNGVISARCADCAEVLSVEVIDSDIPTTDHVVHFAVPATAWWDNIGHA
jgi:hypothetical protein